VYVQSSGMEMTNCTFNRTSSGPSGSGGAVYVHDTNEVVRITSCNFVETEASGANGCVIVLFLWANQEDSYSHYDRERSLFQRHYLFVIHSIFFKINIACNLNIIYEVYLFLRTAHNRFICLEIYLFCFAKKLV
jgi:hypothetical protein